MLGMALSLITPLQLRVSKGCLKHMGTAYSPALLGIIKKQHVFTIKKIEFHEHHSFPQSIQEPLRVWLTEHCYGGRVVQFIVLLVSYYNRINFVYCLRLNFIM